MRRDEIPAFVERTLAAQDATPATAPQPAPHPAMQRTAAWNLDRDAAQAISRVPIGEIIELGKLRQAPSPEPEALAAESRARVAARQAW